MECLRRPDLPPNWRWVALLEPERPSYAISQGDAAIGASEEWKLNEVVYIILWRGHMSKLS